MTPRDEAAERGAVFAAVHIDDEPDALKPAFAEGVIRAAASAIAEAFGSDAALDVLRGAMEDCGVQFDVSDVQ